MIPSDKRGLAPANYGGDVDKEKGEGRKALEWPEYIAIALVLMVVIGVAAILSPGFRCFVANSTTAAWVQAFGSIGAIVGTAVIARQGFIANDKRRQRDDLEAKAEITLACHGAAQDVYTALKNLPKKAAIRNQAGTKIGSERIEEIQSTLRILLGKSVPAALIKPLMGLQREIAFTINDIRLLDASMGATTQADRIEATNQLAKRPDVVISLANEIKSLHRAYLGELRSLGKGATRSENSKGSGCRPSDPRI